MHFYARASSWRNTTSAASFGSSLESSVVLWDSFGHGELSPEWSGVLLLALVPNGFELCASLNHEGVGIVVCIAFFDGVCCQALLFQLS